MAALFKLILTPIVRWLTSLSSFIFARPRIDINIVPDAGNLHGQKALNISAQQDEEVPAVPYVKYDFEFYWNYKIIIRNNSSKTAYNIRIEKIYKGKNDYLGEIDEVASLKETEQIDVGYIIRLYKTCNAREAEAFNVRFPPFLTKLEIIVSYTNEARKTFYTKFTMEGSTKKNEHLLSKPKMEV